jgi:Arc/MetJ-type ribon-helix-helix transcriptional regulator
MRKSIRVHQKKRGRPATGRDPAITVRLPHQLISAINEWTSKNTLSRSEAIRQLIEQGLARKAAARPLSNEAAHRALKMAARELEPLGDKSLPAEEQARRKRVLIKGPKEFRDVRADQPKTKR